MKTTIPSLGTLRARLLLWLIGHDPLGRSAVRMMTLRGRALEAKADIEALEARLAERHRDLGETVLEYTDERSTFERSLSLTDLLAGA